MGRRKEVQHESGEDAIISKDLDGIITSWNRGAERIFGYLAEEVIGKPVTILIPPDHDDEEPAILQRLRRGERIDRYETIRRRKDGRLIDISLTVSPVRNDRGKTIGASKIARDITERKRNEAHIAILAREAEHRVKNVLATVQATVHLSHADTAEGLKGAIAAAFRPWQMYTSCSQNHVGLAPSFTDWRRKSWPRILGKEIGGRASRAPT